MKYNHRVEITATICFDVISDNAELTDDEVRGAVSSFTDLGDGITVDSGYGDLRVYPDGLGSDRDYSELTWTLSDTNKVDDNERETL